MSETITPSHESKLAGGFFELRLYSYYSEYYHWLIMRLIIIILSLLYWIVNDEYEWDYIAIIIIILIYSPYFCLLGGAVLPCSSPQILSCRKSVTGEHTRSRRPSQRKMSGVGGIWAIDPWWFLGNLDNLDNLAEIAGDLASRMTYLCLY